MTSEELKAFTKYVPERIQMDSKVKPDYKSIILIFEGTMEQWGELVLGIHNAYGYGFDYNDLGSKLIEKILEEIPSSESIINANKSKILEDIVKALRNSHKSKFIDMLAVVDEQDGDFWRGDIEAKGLIDYGLV